MENNTNNAGEGEQVNMDEELRKVVGDYYASIREYFDSAEKSIEEVMGRLDINDLMYVKYSASGIQSYMWAQLEETEKKISKFGRQLESRLRCLVDIADTLADMAKSKDKEAQE